MKEKKYCISECECKNEVPIRDEEKEKPSIKVTWKDNGQIVMTMMCYPDEIKSLKMLLDFVDDMADDLIS